MFKYVDNFKLIAYFFRAGLEKKYLDLQEESHLESQMFTTFHPVGKRFDRNQNCSKFWENIMIYRHLTISLAK